MKPHYHEALNDLIERFMIFDVSREEAEMQVHDWLVRYMVEVQGDEVIDDLLLAQTHFPNEFVEQRVRQRAEKFGRALLDNDLIATMPDRDVAKRRTRLCMSTLVLRPS